MLYPKSYVLLSKDDRFVWQLPELASGLRVWSGVVGVVCVVGGGAGADGRGPTSSTV